MAAGIPTPVGRAPVVPVVLAGLGAYLAWFGVHYWRSDVKYPSDPVKAVLTGKPLPAGTPSGSSPSAAISADAAAITPATGTGSGSIPLAAGALNSLPGGAGGSTSAVNAGAAANQAIGAVQAGAYGWSPSQDKTQWDDLVKLWNQESGWNNTAQNPTSTAYGIAQFLDTTWAPYGPKTSDPTTQIQYGLEYIKGRYGSPSGAWAHEVQWNWY